MKTPREVELERLIEHIWQVALGAQGHYAEWRVEEIARLASQPARGLI